MEKVGKGGRRKGIKNLCPDCSIHADSGTGCHGCKLDQCDFGISSGGNDLPSDICCRAAGSCTGILRKTVK